MSTFESKSVKLYVKNNGCIESCVINEESIPFRNDFFEGLCFRLVKDDREQRIQLRQDADGLYRGEYLGVHFNMKYQLEKDGFAVVLSIKNETKAEFEAEKISLRLGVDSFMVEFPQSDTMPKRQ